MTRTSTRRILFAALALGTAVATTVGARTSGRQPKPGHDPGAAKLVTSDLENFLHAHALASRLASATEKQRVFESEYFDKGSPGLRDFVRLRIKSAQDLVHEIETRPKYYASLEKTIPRVAEMEPALRKSFRELEKIYPDAVFPDVYLLIGSMNSGGTTSDSGLLIGLDMHAKTPETDMSEMDDWLKAVLSPIEELPGIVAHELVHYQQAPSGKSLLGQSIHEGGADFVGEMISGQNINAYLRVYGDAHEADLWREFLPAMDGEDVSRWLFQGDSSKDRPADLGYYVGYRIAESYYDHARDKKKAMRDLLRARDYPAFLRASRYADKLGGN